MLNREGWFSDQDPDDDDYDAENPWRPYLQTGGVCVPLRIWCRTKTECDDFIRKEVLGRGMLPDD